MRMSDLIKVCYAACPKEIAWTPHEAYGEFNIEDHNKVVKRVLYCVTPTQQVQAYFLKHKYDLLISHHPYPTRKIPQLIFHTALDCCENGGLNDMWRDAVGLHLGYSHFDGMLGWTGEIEPIPFNELVEKVRLFSGKIDGQVYVRDSIKSKLIKSVVICSGLGGLVLEQARQTKADCYILGENTCLAEDTGFLSVIEIGHTASEWCGVLFFRKLLRGVTVDLAPCDIDVFGTEVFRNRKISSTTTL